MLGLGGAFNLFRLIGEQRSYTKYQKGKGGYNPYDTPGNLEYVASSKSQLENSLKLWEFDNEVIRDKFFKK